MTRDLKILLALLCLCSLAGAVFHGSATAPRTHGTVEAGHPSPGEMEVSTAAAREAWAQRRPLTPPQPDTSKWATGPAPPRVRGLEKLFYGLYFWGPDVWLHVVPGTSPQVDCAYGSGVTRMHCTRPLTWHNALLTDLTNAGITSNRYDFFLQGECHLEVLAYGPPLPGCGTQMLHRASYPEEYPLARGNRAQAAALTRIRSAVADLIVNPAPDARPASENDYAQQNDSWRKYYDGKAPLSAALEIAGLGYDDLSSASFDAATERIEQEFVARYRTQPVH